MINQKNLWFSKLDTHTLCRLGGNGAFHPSQIEGLKLLDARDKTFLDVGCGSATTIECIKTRFWFLSFRYKGVDFSEKHIKWCQENFPNNEFEVQNAMNLKEADNSWDVVWSRHLVDHLSSFEKGLDEHLRVAKRKVICILWRPLGTQDEHQIKNIIDQGKVYKTEYTNDYSRKRVLEHLESKWPEWTPQIRERVGLIRKKTDTIIYLEKNE